MKLKMRLLIERLNKKRLKLSEKNFINEILNASEKYI